MRYILSVIIVFLLSSVGAFAQNWDEIRFSGKYYYGEGRADTYDEAKNMALSELSNSIAVNVQSNFTHLTDYANKNGDIENHQEHVQNFVKTYSQAVLRDVKSIPDNDGKAPFYLRYYIESSALQKMYDNRIKKAKEYIRLASGYLERRKLDMALRDYYWAYMLVQSVQNPNEVEDDAGNLLAVTIPNKINEILDDVKVTFDKRLSGDDADYVDFYFTYNGKPVTSLEFSYNNGMDISTGSEVEDGYGTARVKKSHSGKVYHLYLEYEYKHMVTEDPELMAVMNLFSEIRMSSSGKTVKAENSGSVKTEEAAIVNEHHLQPMASQLVKKSECYKETMDAVLKAIAERRYSDVSNLEYFTFDGLEVFERLISYGSGHVVGVPKIEYFNGVDSSVVARGLNMAFSFKKGKEKTFAENVIFYFDNEGKIDNISFGLGIDTTNDILTRKASAWSDEARETLLEFLENYKTSYALKRLNYIKSVFSDSALIITGKVLKVKSDVNPAGEKNISIGGQQKIEYSRVTKAQYIERLKRVFANNEFINIKFSDVVVRKITKFTDRDVFAIQLAQEYNSSLYSDKGYLLLLVDITNKEEPVIEIRTWQPNEINIDNVFHEGMFY